MRRSAVLLIVAAAAALGQVKPPRIGFFQDAQNRLRPLWGLAANFIVGEPLTEGVISAASSGQWTLVKRQAEVLLLDEEGQLAARWEAPAGSARFAFDALGYPALAFFDTTHLLYRFRCQQWQPVMAIEEELLSLALLDADHAAAIVRSAPGLKLLRILLDGGQLESVLEWPRAETALMTAEGWLLVAQGEELVMLRGEVATRLRLPAPAETFYQLSGDWVAVRLEGDSVLRAVRLRPGELSLDCLAEVEP